MYKLELITQVRSPYVFFYSLPVKTSPISACRRIVHSWYTNTPITGVGKKTLLKTPFTKTYKRLPMTKAHMAYGQVS
jgi:hypothetical protein